VEAQTALAEANSGLPTDRHIDFRIDVHIGDVMVRAGDLFGDGVSMTVGILSAPQHVREAQADHGCMGSVRYKTPAKVVSLDSKFAA